MCLEILFNKGGSEASVKVGQRVAKFLKLLHIIHSRTLKELDNEGEEIISKYEFLKNIRSLVDVNKVYNFISGNSELIPKWFSGRKCLYTIRCLYVHCGKDDILDKLNDNEGVKKIIDAYIEAINICRLCLTNFIILRIIPKKIDKTWLTFLIMH